MKASSDKERRLVEDIKQGGKALDMRLKELYLNPSLWEKIWGFVRARGGEKEDAEDIFQDGIRVLILNIRKDKYSFTGSVEQYLLGICRNLWFGRFREKEKQALIREREAEAGKGWEIDPEQSLISEEQKAQLEALLAQLPAACREVLELWQMGYSMKEIAAKVGYKSEGVARKKKHQCMAKLITFLAEKPLWKDLIR
ncbi:MAG: sigma-70 family RNA polymerase sigma factor [Bacteroidota bacterium]